MADTAPAAPPLTPEAEAAGLDPHKTSEPDPVDVARGVLPDSGPVPA